MSRVKFGRGDIVMVNLDPTEGHEQRGMRPALVLSTSAFNALGVVLVAPITQGGDFSRHAGFAASLSGAGTKTQGVALVNQVRMLDSVVFEANHKNIFSTSKFKQNFIFMQYSALF